MAVSFFTSGEHKAKITARRTQRGTPTLVERQSKRINRQQRRLEKDVGVSALQIQAPRSRVIRYEDIRVIEPLTDTQRDFFEAYEDDAATGYVLYGCAGSGKTFLSVFQALLDVMNPDTPYEKLIIVRSASPVRNLGHLPGNLDEKVAVYELPYHTIFSELTGKKDAYEKMKDMGKVEFISTSAIRGVTFDNSIIIFDEFQSANLHELSTVATRVGRDSKIIFCGDGKQNDLIYNKNDTSGFSQFMDITRIMPSFRNFRFTEDDIVRSGFVKEFLIAYDRIVG